ncbi:hypothetical protein LKO27_01380 [Tessaracoccus sp. OS52]|uniref:DUF6603 domain-containing protein n=1 Tax=Tessaracoccus sp. OS52 TaxID=2886691 RepID=UPI001D106CDF|nr:DUF6603 domain-containing protein [Tessaracoccus sp. OS52]MCC2592081.1 hypothetical protein [Tessaracoccus sp. OS52]
MAEDEGTLAALGEALARLVEPLEDRLTGGDLRVLLAELGLNLPASVDADGALSAAGQATVQRITDLPPVIADLADAVAAEDTGQIIAKALQLATGVAATVDGIADIAAAIKGLSGTGVPTAELNQFADQLPGRLVDYLLVRNLEEIPGAAAALDFIGFVERVDVPAVDVTHPAFVRRSVDFAALSDFLTDPSQHLRALYQWGDPGFTGDTLLATLNRLLAGAGVPAVLDTSGPVPVLDVLAFELSPKLDAPTGLRIRIAHPLEVNPAPITQDDWSLAVELNTPIVPGVEAIITADDGVSLVPATPGRVEGDLAVTWTGGSAAGTPYVVLGEPGGSRLEIRKFIATGKVGFAHDTTNGRGEGTWKLGGEVQGGRLVVSLAGADGFLGTILSGFGLDSQFDLGVGFSSAQGLFFAGSATLDIQLPLHIQLGPVEISALTLTVGIADDSFPIGLTTNLRTDLGPLKAVVEQIGIGADLTIPPDRSGNVGPLDFALRFLPPKGVGLSLDVGAVKGGGYLFIDPERGEYAGAVELSLFETVSIQAIGIITTRMPDGSSGFSLLIIMSVGFGTGIQLGFGFTLLAVGGLVGLNRTMNLQALAEGIRSGAIESVMFPSDIVANAPKIISDLRAFFPPREGTFLVGPMVKLGWGTPTLASLSLGVIIEIPGNIAIVGIIKVAIPADDVAVIVLQVNFIGAIEFDKQRLWFFAALYESRVAFLTIEGEMGLLVAWGQDANFVLSVGGFHPRFSPPPLPFPSPRRVCVDLINTPVARVSIQGYFAVTSNTVQFGARVDAFFGSSDFNAQGFLAIDALFQFSPFWFIVEISASFSVRAFGVGLLSVSIRGELEGPTPWHVKGHGSISLLFFDIDVEFEHTWGDAKDTVLDPVQVLPVLDTEIRKTDNWRAILPTSSKLMVAIRSMPQEEAAGILHPVGVLRISQRALPLDLVLDKVGAQKPSDVNRLEVQVTGGGLAKVADATEQFAPAQFRNFSDAEKLSQPAFTPEHSGLDLSASGADVRSSMMAKRVVRYEEIILDNNYKRFARRFSGFAGTLFQFFLGGAAVTRNPMSQAMRKKTVPFEDKVEVHAEQFVVATSSDNKAFSSTAVFQSQASAQDFLTAQVKADPSLAESLHVIPGFEAVS